MTKKTKQRARIDELIATPYLGLVTRKATKKDLAPGKSRIGGIPDLARRTKWPASNGSMLFAAQLDLADIAPFDTKNLLPATGLLSFFVASHQECAVLYTDAAVEPAAWPDDVDFSGGEAPPLTACGVVFEQIKHSRKRDSYHCVLWAHGGGEPSRRIEADDIILLQLDTDDRADMEWGDCGCLYFVIDRASLAKRAWKRVRLIPSE